MNQLDWLDELDKKVCALFDKHEVELKDVQGKLIYLLDVVTDLVKRLNCLEAYYAMTRH